MQALTSEWDTDVQRGPDWLIVKLRHPRRHMPDCSFLADELWTLLQRHFVYRLVLQMDDVPVLSSPVLGQLVLLEQRIRDHHGMLRLCGLTPENQRVLRRQGLLNRLPAYRCPEEAVTGRLPNKPR